ncbi:acyltransferase family protein [Polymorphospora rubra]|uniref:acyltransferase family protein n=1 Tax=Polymorphospora rubra TaxID=338584 RepID=UPI0033D8BC33
MGKGILERLSLVPFGGRLPTLADRFDSRANSIGALRLVLAFAVLVAHCWPLVLGRSMLGSAESMRQTDVGKLAVYGFFVLSGFLITGSALRFSLPRYLWHRALRVLPGLWVCLLATALVMAPAVAYYERGNLDGFWNHPDGPLQYLWANWTLAMDQWTISGILADVPYGRGLEGGGPVNGSLWSLRYEVLCYIMLAALVAASVLARAPGAVVLLLLGTTGSSSKTSAGATGSSSGHPSTVNSALTRLSGPSTNSSSSTWPSYFCSARSPSCTPTGCP